MTPLWIVIAVNSCDSFVYWGDTHCKDWVRFLLIFLLVFFLIILTRFESSERKEAQLRKWLPMLGLCHAWQACRTFSPLVTDVRGTSTGLVILSAMSSESRLSKISRMPQQVAPSMVSASTPASRILPCLNFYPDFYQWWTVIWNYKK